MIKLMGQEDKILILGARGNLGGQLTRVLGNEYRLVCWDREEIDITEQEQVKEKIIAIKPNIIINAAAYNAVDECEKSVKEFLLAEKINGKAVGYLADAALHCDALLVHYSTDYVFGGNDENGYKEDAMPGPISKYGETKFLGEKKLQKRVEQGLRWYLIRTSKLFGPQSENQIGKPSFFDIMLKLAKEKNEIDVINEEVDCFTYAPDLAKATKKLIESKRPHGIYHITNSGPCIWYEAAVELFRLANVKIKVNPVSSDKFPRPAKRPKFSVLLNTKLEPLRDYKDALREYLELEAL